MSLRDKLQNSTVLVVGVSLAALLLAGYVIISQANSNKLVTEYYTYYSDDDGKSSFTDNVDKIVPYKKGGKEVVRAHVFDVGGNPTVLYLSKLSDEAKAAVDRYNADLAKKPPDRPASWGGFQAAMANGWLYKKPGDVEWSKKLSDLHLNLKDANGNALHELQYLH